MQREALDDERISWPFCYARNTRDAFLVSYLWLESYRKLDERAKSKTKKRNLLEGGNWAPSELRNNYSSRTLLRLLQKHKGLVDFLELMLALASATLSGPRQRTWAWLRKTFK